jgi:hypothetical protein
MMTPCDATRDAGNAWDGHLRQEIALALLVAGPPADRALNGWCPAWSPRDNLARDILGGALSYGGGLQ